MCVCECVCECVCVCVCVVYVCVEVDFGEGTRKYHKWPCWNCMLLSLDHSFHLTYTHVTKQVT